MRPTPSQLAATLRSTAPALGGVALLGRVVLGLAVAVASGCTTRVIQVRPHDPLFDDDPPRDRVRPGSGLRSTAPPVAPADVPAQERPEAWRNGAAATPALAGLLDAAEQEASPLGRQVLQTGRAMVEQGQVVVGSCWTFATAVYAQAGFAGRQRDRVHKGKLAGPYADPELFRPGDFLSYVNHSYNGVEHSAIFVRWLDRERVEALMLSYVGSNRRVPGSYRSYLLTHVYSVMRPKN